MKLHVLGSSSRGNCYLLQSEKTGEVLVLEAGVNMRQVKSALGFHLDRVVGCCITHEHSDHAKYVDKFAEACIPMVMSTGTAKKLGIQEYRHQTPKHAIRLGGFRILSFPTMHDAAQPCGYLIQHEECGTVLFATDTYYLPNKFAGLNNILLECNYDLDILDRNIEAGIVHRKVRDRIIRSHMSYTTCCETLQANDLSQVNNIVLLHLSGDNSAPSKFSQGIYDLTGKHVHCAHKGLCIDLNKTPY